MNINLYPVSFKKYSLTLLYASLFLAIITWGMELYFEKLEGDLTRIGNFSEHDFGWRMAQPSIPSEQFEDSSLSDADILVIGDSFSIPLVWQTRLVAENFKVTTLHWQDIKKYSTYGTLTNNLGSTLKASGFKGRYVIIESVERSLQQRMRALSDESADKIVKYKTISATPPVTQRERISLRHLNGEDWGLKTLFNSIKLALNLPNKYFQSRSAIAIKYNGCQFFTHRLCQYLLLVKDDYSEDAFDTIDKVLIVNKSLLAAGIQPVWVIVPDKSTVYLGYDPHNSYPYPSIWQQFSKYPELVAPDLGKLFIQQSRIIKDFYLPDDAHLNTKAYLYLGDIILKGLDNMQANKPKPFSQ